MISYLDIAEAPDNVNQFVKMTIAHDGYLYLTRDGIPHVVAMSIHESTELPLTETDTAPRKLAALIEVIETQGKPIVLACGDQPLIALVPYRGGIGRDEVASYRKLLREQAIYMRCINEWGYDPDYADLAE